MIIETTWSVGDYANLAVCVGTFGNRDHWERTAKGRALPSADRQTRRPTRTTWCHHNDLHLARNKAASPQGPPLNGTDAEWLCFLDADDELDPSFVAAMGAATEGLAGDWLLQPATLGVYSDGREDAHPVVIPPKPLVEGNYLVISTVIRATQFHRLGGFRHWPVYEDWDLWLRASRDGAHVKTVPDAVLRVHVSERSRNNGDRATQIQTYNQIRTQHLRGL